MKRETDALENMSCFTRLHRTPLATAATQLALERPESNRPRALTRVGMEVPYNLVEGAEAAESFKVRQRHGHLRLVVVVFVNVRPLGVKSLG